MQWLYYKYGTVINLLLIFDIYIVQLTGNSHGTCNFSSIMRWLVVLIFLVFLPSYWFAISSLILWNWKSMMCFCFTSTSLLSITCCEAASHQALDVINGFVTVWKSLHKSEKNTIVLWIFCFCFNTTCSYCFPTTQLQTWFPYSTPSNLSSYSQMLCWGLQNQWSFLPLFWNILWFLVRLS